MSTPLFDLPTQQQEEKRGGRSQLQTASTVDPSTFPSVASQLQSNYNNNSHNKNNTDSSSSPFSTNTAAFHSPYGGLQQDISVPHEQGQASSSFPSCSSPSAPQPSSFWTPPPSAQHPSPYQPSSTSHPSNDHPYQQQPPATRLTGDDHQPTATTTYPWAIHSATSSVSVSDLPNATPTATTTSRFHPQRYSERRKLVQSFQSSVDSSRAQTPVAMDSRPRLGLSNNGDNHDNNNKGMYLPSGTEEARFSRQSLETLSNSRPLSPVLNKTAKKPFWMSFPRRFRPKGAVRPKKSDSWGNKKAKFSNERTLVHWIKAAMLLGSLSMTLLSFSENNVTPYIGAVLITICCLTLVYSVTTFQVRMEWIDMRRDDVVYYDRKAPTVLSVLLMATFAFNAVVTYTGDFTSNKVYLHKKGFDG
ncbi:hypothetical protein EMPS_00926 [Entomortierella parvispora]|uniref:DUF202 domain-containing protein n=1 Tax=Entomortierella parvispora TaxID=205924 RepID=A0A9P3H1X0_9FUNG|nr:hypothetical protein EMPS_00926 [Entomortierella parvispora]